MTGNITAKQKVAEYIMADIFLSYAREDAVRARQLAAALEANGWTVWWDRQIPAGKTFDEVIEQALAKAKCVIVLWSEKSVKSRWVRTEATEGAERQILVPVLLESVDLPLEFRRIQAADLRSWEGDRSAPAFLGLLKDLSALAQGRSADYIVDYEAQSHPKPPVVSHRTRLTQTESPMEPSESQAASESKKVEKHRPRRIQGQVVNRAKAYLLGSLIAIPILPIFVASIFGLLFSGAIVLVMIFGPKGQSFDPETVVIIILSLIGFFGSVLVLRKVERRFFKQHEGSDGDSASRRSNLK